jgi:hypothetical protein
LCTGVVRPPGGTTMRRQPTLTLPDADPRLNHLPRIGPTSTSNGSTESQCTIDTRSQVFHCHMARSVRQRKT